MSETNSVTPEVSPESEQRPHIGLGAGRHFASRGVTVDETTGCVQQPGTGAISPGSLGLEFLNSMEQLLPRHVGTNAPTIVLTRGEAAPQTIF